MNIKVKLLLLAALCLHCSHSDAVQVGQKGMGQVLIYPYYTVNNDLNTTYSIVNTTDQPKALRIRFLEGQIARDVLSFNIYLAGYDVWTGVMTQTVSTRFNHEGEPSVLHLTADASCAPYLNKEGQEFLTHYIDLNPSNNSLERALEGHMEVIEMGELTGDAAEAVVHSFGAPRDCDLLESEWDDADWSLGDLDNPSGGITGSASLINVAEGILFSYDAVALENFWNEAGTHTESSHPLPNLSSAFPQSKVLLSDGELAVSEWSTGYEAVSAVLMQASVINEYAYDSAVAGKSEWVMTFPTKIFHVADDATDLDPFEFTWDGAQSCDALEVNIWDRSAVFEYIPRGCIGSPCPPIDYRPRVCYSSNVIEFISPDSPLHESSSILGSNNVLSFNTPTVSHVTENGWASIEFDDMRKMEPVEGTPYQGLPVVGFMVQQFTNAAAQAGLLAQYGGLFMHKGVVVTDDEN